MRGIVLVLTIVSLLAVPTASADATEDVDANSKTCVKTSPHKVSVHPGQCTKAAKVLLEWVEDQVPGHKTV